jgi:hypothetical protein
MNSNRHVATILSWLTMEVAWETLRPADACIAFGGATRAVPEAAAQAYHAKLAPIIVCTGAKTPLTEHLPFSSEAEFFADICRGLHVPDSALIIEPRATNTGENVRFALELLRQSGIEPRILLLAAKPFHQRRVVQTVARWLPDCAVQCLPVLFTQEQYTSLRGYTYEERLVHEVERLQTYPSQGFIAPVVIPTEVVDACDALRV